MGLRIQLFGEFAVWRDNTLITDWDSTQLKTLLKILLSQRGRAFLNEQLIEYLWPNQSDPHRALKFLRAYVHNLRQLLEPAALDYRYVETCSGGYRFSATTECTVDAEEFITSLERANRLNKQREYAHAVLEYDQALSFYQAEYLPEDRYEDWAAPEREKFHRAHLQALLGLAECHARQGDYRPAVDLCRQALAIDKYSEDIYRQAMIYNYLRGNPGEALRLYQECEKVLSQELQLQPGASLRALYSQIQAGHIPGVDSDYPASALVPHPIHHSLARLPFRGRDEEYSRLVHFLETAAQGKGGLVLVGGETGVGKTRLIQETIQYAQHQFGATVLQGRCTELSAKQPYHALTQAVREHLLTLDQSEFQQLPLLSLSVLAPWIPNITERCGSFPVLAALSPEQEQLRFFEGIRQLLRALSQGHPPLLLFLDDLQWTDPSTVDFLDYLLLQISEFAVLVLATYRSDEVSASHPVASLQRRALRERESGTYHLQLEELPRKAVEEMISHQAPELKDYERFSRYLYQKCGGNPFFLVTVLQSLFEAGRLSVTRDGQWTANVDALAERHDRLQPREIQELISARMQRLDSAERQLLELMSVIGERGELKLLSHLWQRLMPSEGGELGWMERLEQLEKAHFIYGEASHYSFVHEYLREVAYQEIGAARARLLHRYVADALEEFSKHATEQNHGMLAHHWVEAGQLPRALEHLLLAMKEAIAGYRNTEGLEFATEASTVIETLAAQGTQPQVIQRAQFELLSGKIKIYEMSGRRSEQETTLAELFEIVYQMDDDEKIAKTHLMQATLYMHTARYSGAQAECLKALKIALDKKNFLVQSQALLTIALAYRWMGDFSQAHAYLQQAYELQSALRDEKTLAKTFHYLGLVSWQSGQHEEAAKHYRQALGLLIRIDDRQARASVLLDMGVMHWSRGNYKEALTAFEEVRRLAAEIGDRRAEANALSSLGTTGWSLGAYELALKYLTQAAEIHRTIGDKRVYSLDLNNLGLIYWSLARDTKARECFESVLQLSQEIGWPQGTGYALQNLGLLHWRSKEFAKALKLGAQALQVFRQSGDQQNLGILLRNLGEICCDAGKYPQALEHLEQALVISRALGSKLEEMQVLSDQSATYLRMKDKAKALDCSQSAIDFLKKIKRFPHAQQVLYFHYRALTAAGQEQAARKFLHRAYKALMRRAKRITNPEFRESFLKNVPIHREIVETYARHFQRFHLSETECYELLRRVRWAKGVACPYCNGRKIRVHGQVNRTSEKRYVCMRCDKTFNDRTETVFAHKNISLAKLFQALLWIAHASEGAGTTQALSKELKIQRKTVAKLHRELSASLKEDALVQRLAERLRKSSSD